MVYPLTFHYFMLIFIVTSSDIFFNHALYSAHVVKYATDVDIILFNCVIPTYFLEQTVDLYDIFANTQDTNKCINDILEEFEMIELCKQLSILGKKQCHYNENHQSNGLILQRENKSNGIIHNVTTFKAGKTNNAQNNSGQ